MKWALETIWTNHGIWNPSKISYRVNQRVFAPLDGLMFSMANPAIREVLPFTRGWEIKIRALSFHGREGENTVRDSTERKVHWLGPDILGKLSASDTVCFKS